MGAEFKNRPGLKGLVAALPEFDVVVMNEESRLARAHGYSDFVVYEIYAAGHPIHFYLTDEVLRLDTAQDRFMLSARCTQGAGCAAWRAEARILPYET